MKYILSAALLLIATLSLAENAQNNKETIKINYLINSLESLKGATFIRNGSEYNGKEAANHMRYKLKRAGNKVRTAEDFIRICGAKSNSSGKPYIVRYLGGKTITSEEYFRSKLKEFNSKTK